MVHLQVGQSHFLSGMAQTPLVVVVWGFWGKP
jgi:hypothetical protein